MLLPAYAAGWFFVSAHGCGVTKAAAVSALRGRAEWQELSKAALVAADVEVLVPQGLHGVLPGYCQHHGAHAFDVCRLASVVNHRGV